MKCVLIINPNSGRKHFINKDKIIKIFSKHNYDLDIIYTQYKGHAKEIRNCREY